MRILLTNDDGYDAPGLAALYRALVVMPEASEVVVVAPLEGQSAMSHAITLHRPMDVTRRTVDGKGDAMPGYAVDGRPADCVKVGLAELAGGAVDLVVSGMNAGANIGLNVLYSGTVGAAREAAFAGLPAVAVSLYLMDREAVAWDRAARHAVDAMRRTLAAEAELPANASAPLPLDAARLNLERGTVLNINVPFLDHGREPRGITAAELCLDPAQTRYTDQHLSAPPPDESAAAHRFLPGSTLTYDGPPPGCDVERLFAGYTVVTPLHFDLTHRGEVDRLRAALATVTV